MAAYRRCNSAPPERLLIDGSSNHFYNEFVGREGKIVPAASRDVNDLHTQQIQNMIARGESEADYAEFLRGNENEAGLSLSRPKGGAGSVRGTTSS